MRMGMRRITRLTNAFSKKAENHAYAVALHFMHHNYCRIHQTLRVTPAMAANLVASPWTVDDIVALVEKGEDAAPKKCGPYKKRQKKKFQSEPTTCLRRYIAFGDRMPGPRPLTREKGR